MPYIFARPAATSLRVLSIDCSLPRLASHSLCAAVAAGFIFEMDETFFKVIAFKRWTDEYQSRAPLVPAAAAEYSGVAPITNWVLRLASPTARTLAGCRAEPEGWLTVFSVASGCLPC